MAPKSKRIVIAVAAVLVGLVALAVILPFVIPVETYRGQIEQAAQAATGRTLRIAGPLRLTIIPNLGISAGDIAFSNKPGGVAETMASMDEVEISVALLPLLGGNIQVSKIILKKPVINLEVDRAGNNNWTFAGAQAQSSSEGGLPEGLRLSGIEITDGHLSYANAQTGKSQVIEDLDLSVDVTEQSRPVSIDGRFMRDEQPISFNGTLTTPKTLLENELTSLDMTLSADLMHVAFVGEIAPDRALTGEVKFSTSSLRNLGTWLGMDMPAGGGLQAVTLDGKVSSKNGVVGLSDVVLVLDGMTIRGSLSADTNPALTFVKGNISVDHLDVNPYMQTADQAAAKSAGWSTAPIAFDALRKFNADLTLSAGNLTVRNFHIGQSSVALRIQNGSMRANLNPISLYQGSGQALFTVDARPAMPQIGGTMRFENVALASLLGDAIGVNKIEGAGTLVLDISSSGNNANAIMHALGGKGSLTIGNGKIRGVNLGMVARTIQTALSGAPTGDSASTDFSQISGTYTIANGVLTNRDFRLTGPALNATGAGTIDIGNQTIDFTIQPRANVGVANVGIPFRVSGPWSSPRYLPDLGGLAKGVATDLIQNPSNSGGLLGNILGGSSSKDGQSSNPLGGLLGR